jgi:hypothetical protein
MVESNNQWYHQKVLLKSFPMNGHVITVYFVKLEKCLDNFCVCLPLVTEVTIVQSLKSYLGLVIFVKCHLNQSDDFPPILS